MATFIPGDNAKIFLYSKAIEKNNNYFQAYIDRAEVRKKNGNFDKAMEDINLAMKLRPEDELVWYLMGELEYRKGNTDKAINILSTCIAINSAFPWSYQLRAKLFKETAQAEYAIIDEAKYHYLTNDSKNALAILDEGIVKFPANVIMYEDRSNVRLKLKDKTGAIKDLDKVIELASHYVWGFYKRGELKEKLKDFTGALDDMDKAMNIDPGFAQGLYKKGLIYKEIKNYKDAAETIYQSAVIFKRKQCMDDFRECIKILKTIEGSSKQISLLEK